ncbi:MAG TPA: hypothetical protein VNF73_06140 [Candidatus Saccharimonadales bacterium]|nr:hypothetical protein [Candidatus Saccharimonadales bacterium]
MRKQLLRRTPSGSLALHAVGSYAQGHRAGNLVFLQGQTGLTLDGELVAPNAQPCSTGLIVSGLAIEELVVEIDAYGVVDGAA